MTSAVWIVVYLDLLAGTIALAIDGLAVVLLKVFGYTISRRAFLFSLLSQSLAIVAVSSTFTIVDIPLADRLIPSLIVFALTIPPWIFWQPYQRSSKAKSVVLPSETNTGRSAQPKGDNHATSLETISTGVASIDAFGRNVRHYSRRRRYLGHSD